MQVKVCIISAVFDDKFIEWYKTLSNLPLDWRIYILRNKPLLESTYKVISEMEHFNRTEILEVANENYRSVEMEGCNLKFVKLRYDSLMLAKPKEDEWIMFGDDDMFILDEFREDIKQLEKVSDDIDWCVASHLPHGPELAKDAVFEGIRHGQFFKYKIKAFEEYKRFIDCVGAGEDSILALIYYKWYRTVKIFLPSVEHPGANLSTYLSTQYHPDYLSSKVFSYLYEGFTQKELYENGLRQKQAYASVQSRLLPFSEKEWDWEDGMPDADIRKDYREKSNDGRPFVCSFGKKMDKRICKYWKPLGNKKTHICHWYAYNDMCVCKGG